MHKGLTFIDVLVGMALVLIVFLGIFAAYQLGLKVVGQSRNKITATALANQWLEIIRNLSYEDVGTIGAFPSPPYAQGVLEPATTTVLNNTEYYVTITVKYIADEADGLAEDCPNDYKRAEVRVSWPGRFSGEVKLSTDIAPKNLQQECEISGGILSVTVFDAYGQLVPFPFIEIKDPETGNLIDSASPADGKYNFPLATSTYKVLVSKDGYSSEETFAAGDSYQGKAITIPEKPHPIVLDGQLTETSFSIDKVSAFSVDTLSPWGEDFWADSFDDETKISEKSNLVVSGGEVSLSKMPGVYFTGGTSDGDLCAFPGTDGDCGQSFTMGSQTKTITQVSLYIKKATVDPSDIWLEMRSESPVGPVMASSTLVDSATLPTNLEWITFTFQNPVTLSANTQYFLRLRSLPDSTDPWSGAQGYIYWGYLQAASAPPAYAGGDAWRYIGRNLNPSDPGQQLGPADQYDFSFKIFDDEYLPSGYLISTAISPTDLLKWNEFSFTDYEPAQTDLKYQIYYASGTEWYLIPDSDLPGNSSGFDSSPVDLSDLSTTTYSQLKVRANFSTNTTTSSPTLKDWQISWITSAPTPIGNVSFFLQGTKLVGYDANENPIYKYSATSTSDSNGHIDIPNLEWDSYTFSLDPATGLDLVGTSPSPQPIALSPNTSQQVKLYLKSENSLLLTLKDSETLEPIFSASTTLSNLSLGYSQTQYTNEKGQTLFIPLEVANYNLDLSAPGYLSTSTTIFVSGDISKTIKLNRIE